MPFSIACPNCDARLQAPDEAEGKRIKCKKCGETFVAWPVDEDQDDRRAPPAANLRPRPVRDAEDEHERAPRPARTSRHNDGDDYEADAGRRRDEDEPPPRKKRGKKKAAGPPVLLILLIAVGAVVLIGGGVGAYVYFSDDRKPDDAQAKGGPNANASRTGGPIPAAGSTAGWVEQHEPAGRYRIKFPTAPERQTRPAPAGAQGEVVIYRSRSDVDDFLALHRSLTAAEQGPGNEDRLINQFLNVAKLPVEDQISERKDITYQSFKGREMLLTAPGKQGGVVFRLIIAGNRVIVLSVLAETISPDAPRVKAFFESLRIE